MRERKAGEPFATELDGEFSKPECGVMTRRGPCRNVAADGGPCHIHRARVEEVSAAARRIVAARVPRQADGTLEVPVAMPLREKCRHPRAEYKGDNAHADGEWFHCPDCGKRWVEDLPL